ncbi:MAG: PilN domain-containing protein [Betaproteobacteria bacterium]|nr:PilN domain-containing protein [Betaproteobacteria bacterium]
MNGNVNLFDPALRKPKVLLPSGQVAAGWIAGTVFLLAWYGWESYELHRASTEQRQVSRRSTEVQEQVKRLSSALAARKPSPEMVTQVEERTRKLESRQAVADRLNGGDFGAGGGHAAVLRALARSVPSGLWLTGVTVNGNGTDIRIEGRTLDPELVPRFLGALGQDPSLKGRGFNRLEFRPPDASTQGGDGKAAAPRPSYLEFSVASRIDDAPAVR